MDFFDLVKAQNRVFESRAPESPYSNRDFILQLMSDCETLADIHTDLETTFSPEIPREMQEAWINVAFMALQAAYQAGADKVKFEDAIQNILAKKDVK